MGVDENSAADLEGKQIRAEFFQYENGTRPVRDWLITDLNDEERKQVGGDIATVEFEWPIGPPLVKKVGKFWEVRTTMERGWARVLIVVEKDRMILIHGIINKSKKIPQDDLAVAEKRLALLRKE